MIRLLALLAATASAAAQSAAVVNLADSGAGSLRAAIQQANASSGAFTIEVRVTGTVPLRSALPPIATGRAVAVRTGSGGGPLVLDATSFTGGSQATVLAVHGGGTDIEVPLVLRLGRGVGFDTDAADVRLADLAVEGGDVQGVAAVGATRLRIDRLRVTGAGQGVLIQNCNGTRLGEAQPIRVENCRDQGIVVNGGGNNVVAGFVCSGNSVGVLAVNTSGLTLGSLGGPRSLAHDNRAHGLQLQNVANASAVAVQNADLVRNAIVGIVLDRCQDIRVRDVVVDGNRQSGIELMPGCARIAIGPGVVARNTPSTVGRLGPGVLVLGATQVDVTGCTFGPGNGIGLSITAGTARSSQVTVSGSHAFGNDVGIDVHRADGTTISTSLVENNFGTGVRAMDAAGFRLQTSRVRDNAGYGLELLRTGDVVVGPGNVVDANRLEGCFVGHCQAPQVLDNVSISHNRSTGLTLFECPRPVVRNTRFTGNAAAGVWVQPGSDDAVVGPAVAITETLGSGLILESTNNVYVHASVFSRNSSAGISIVSDLRALTPHTIVSCVITDNSGMGVLARASQGALCALCTVAGNLRGLYAAQIYRGSPTRLEGDSCVVWGNTLEDYNTSQTDGIVTLRNSFFRVPQPAGNGNRADDPRYVATWCGDYRLRGDSPAIDAGNAAIPLPPGALDGHGQPRVAGARVDCGAHEVQVQTTILQLWPDCMPLGGGDVDFSLRYPASDAGALSVLFLQVGPPAGSFPFFGATVPLAPSPFLLLLAEDPSNVATLAFVAGNGSVDGRIRWQGRLPPSLTGTFSLCAASLGTSPWRTRTVSNVVTMAVQ